ncbi:LPXTG cell wall anchor domain-containing protein [Arthrobacter cheniae]|uniref:LPXTG cell wall anchor domain-containing protein n=1 Tax=Arthrobacter cheniae TaxID=1258888 RepID=A0A3A5M7T4_9MICC|nr:LPXTG cell wall anchor domain-containing protein [Arthrobacter cheniae]RJT80917.1 LPXTG cell wall anchor domain-containing protein [Arthrobacter cheniae]
MNKSTSVLALAGTLAFLGAGAAQAAPASIPAYVPVQGGAVSDGTVTPGATVTFTGVDGFFGPFQTITITVDRSNGRPGGPGFSPRGGAGTARGGIIVLNAVVLTEQVKAGANGNFSTSVKLEEEGVYTLTASNAEGKSLSQTVVVDPANAVDGTTGGTSGGTSGGATSSVKGLANTGIDSAMLLWGAAGIGALGLGAGSIVVARRRSAVA